MLLDFLKNDWNDYEFFKYALRVIICQKRNAWCHWPFNFSFLFRNFDFYIVNKCGNQKTFKGEVAFLNFLFCIIKCIIYQIESTFQVDPSKKLEEVMAIFKLVLWTFYIRFQNFKVLPYSSRFQSRCPLLLQNYLADRFEKFNTISIYNSRCNAGEITK